VSTQKYKALATIIRVNATALIVFRCRSALELQAIIEENSAVYDKDTLLRLYHEATDEPYSFLVHRLRGQAARRTCSGCALNDRFMVQSRS
jgi:hypothetical protein